MRSLVLPGAPLIVALGLVLLGWADGRSASPACCSASAPALPSSASLADRTNAAQFAAPVPIRPCFPSERTRSEATGFPARCDRRSDVARRGRTDPPRQRRRPANLRRACRGGGYPPRDPPSGGRAPDRAGQRRPAGERDARRDRRRCAPLRDAGRRPCPTAGASSASRTARLPRWRRRCAPISSPTPATSCAPRWRR